jgi:hypothetical protein
MGTDGPAEADDLPVEGPRNKRAAWVVEMPITRRRCVVLILGMIGLGKGDGKGREVDRCWE